MKYNLLGISVAKLIICFAFALCYSLTAYARPTIKELKEIKGTCVSNCGIEIVAENLVGTNIRYGLIDYPSTGQTRIQDTPIFSNLEPGTYKVGVYDNTTGNDPVTATITISTSYIEMFASQPTDSNDPSNGCNDNGTISLAFTGGTAPFRYRIFKESTVVAEVTANSRSQRFTGLASGSYTFEIKDACDQYCRNKPESPIMVTSYSNPFKDEVINSITIQRVQSNSYIYAANPADCDKVTVRIYYTDIDIRGNESVRYNANNSQLRYYIQSPAETGTWSSVPLSGTTTLSFSGVPYAAGSTYRIKVVHPCTGDEKISNTLTYPPEVSTLSASASNSGSYTDFCNVADNPSATVSLYNSGVNIIRNYVCDKLIFTLKENGEIIDTSEPLLVTSRTYNSTIGPIVAGHTYTVEVKSEDGSRTFSEATFTVPTVSQRTPASTYYTSFSAGTSYTYAGYNYGRSCPYDFDHTRVYVYRNSSFGSSKAKYTIIEGPEGVDISGFEAKEVTYYYYSTLWDNVPYGTYKVKVEYEGCPTPREETMVLNKPMDRFEATLTSIETASVCGTFTLVGSGKYMNGTSSVGNSYNSRFYMKIIEGPLKHDGTKTEGLRSSSYGYSSNNATITGLPGGKYKVIFYSYSVPTYTHPTLGSAFPQCYYVEKEITIDAYERPKLDVPYSGGISCSQDPDDPIAVLTLTGKGSKPDFLYRYKKSTDPESAYPIDFSEEREFTGLTPGDYDVQILDQCGNIGTQTVTIYKNGDQIVEIIGGVDDENGETVICMGQSVTLQVKSVGPALSYKWFKSETGVAGSWGEPIEGATGPYYTITNVQPGDEGFYMVELNNTTCDIRSSVHIVGIREPIPAPTIVGPAVFCRGTSFTLMADYDNDNVTYQWYIDGNPITGATAKEYTGNISSSYTVVAIPPIGCPSNPSTTHPIIGSDDACVQVMDDEFEMNACEGVQYINVLSNDKTNGCAVALAIVAGPSSGGTAIVEEHEGIKKIKYTPKATFTGVDVFTYKIACGTDESSVATVYVHVKSSIMVEVLSNDHASEPNAKGKFTIRFSCAGVVYSKPLDVTYAINGTASSGTDYTPLTGTVRIPANTSSVSLEVVPQNNFLIEGNSREVTIEITGIAEGA